MSLVIDLFRKYIHVPSASREDTGAHPSTPEQLEMAKVIEKDMIAMGISEVKNTGRGYLYGKIPGNTAGQPAIGLIAHLDVVDNEPCSPMNEKIIENYDGSALNIGNGVILSPELYPALGRCIGKDLIVTDGKTILGADDKAGVAEIMALADKLIKDPTIPHGDIMIAFTPDEEIGGGAEELDIPEFGAEFAYTVDGGIMGEMEYENFNAASAKVTFKGLAIHPGSAKNKMKNAALMAVEYASMLPESETPAHTEGHEGFYHLGYINATGEAATLAYILRDHDYNKLQSRKAFMVKCAEFMNMKYGEDTCEIALKDGYRNMLDVMHDHMDVVERAANAYRKCGMNPTFPPVRGGTDGARLSWRGLPCPNLSTGGMNGHGVRECACVQDMETMVDVLTEIVRAR